MTLALQGGQPVRTKPVPPHQTTGQEERDAVSRVFDSGYLSLLKATGRRMLLFICGGLKSRN